MPSAASAEPWLLDRPPGEAAARLAESGGLAWIFVDPTEYHGPHLSLRNDHHLAVGLARAAQASFNGQTPLIGASLALGVDPTPGPGTVASSFQQVQDAVSRAALALTDLGARYLVAMTWHGAPLHAWALERGLEPARRRGVRAFCAMSAAMRQQLSRGPELYAPMLPLAAPGHRAQVEANLDFDLHAGFVETSLALALAPETVSAGWRDLPPCPRVEPDPRLLCAARWAERAGQRQTARELGLAAFGVAWHRLRPFPGYTGHPAGATAEAGQWLVQAVAETLAGQLGSLLRGEPQLPPAFRWLEALTLQGRWKPPGA